MRYFRIEFLDDAKTFGFMEVDDNGFVTRLTDVDGSTYVDLPHQSYRTLDTAPAALPSWADEADKIVLKEQLRANFIAASEAKIVVDKDIDDWKAEVAQKVP